MTTLDARAREEICRVGRSLFARGYVHAAAGNISWRLETSILVTPTDACLGFLDPADIAEVNHAGVLLAGGQPSKSLALHRSIYQEVTKHAPDIRCIVHTHSACATALSLVCNDVELLPALTPYFVMKVGRVPLLPYCRPGDPATGQAVAETIARYAAAGTVIRAVMLKRLGPNVWHRDAAQAMATLEELEETAKLALLTRNQPQAPLTPGQIDELRQSFGACW